MIRRKKKCKKKKKYSWTKNSIIGYYRNVSGFHNPWDKNEYEEEEER